MYGLVKVPSPAAHSVIPLLLFILLSLDGAGVVGIRNVVVNLPAVATLGSNVKLECSFDMENETLYSIKLYKGSQEFLHFIPEFRPPHSVYKVRGVLVTGTNLSLNSLEFSYNHEDQIDHPSLPLLKKLKVGIGVLHAELLNVDLFSQGVYTCEISADSPSWDTGIASQRLHVLVEPESRPTIHGIQTFYRPGQDVQLTCKTESVSVEKETEDSGLMTTLARLQAPVFQETKVKCLASLWTHHYQSKDYVILVKDPPTASVRANQTHGGKNGGTGTAGNQLEPVFQPSVTAGAGWTDGGFFNLMMLPHILYLLYSPFL